LEEVAHRPGVKTHDAGHVHAIEVKEALKEAQRVVLVHHHIVQVADGRAHVQGMEYEELSEGNHMELDLVERLKYRLSKRI